MLAQEEMQNCSTLSESYGFSLSDINFPQHRSTIGEFAATVIDARLMVALTEKEVSDSARKKRLSKHVDRVGEYSKLFGIDLKHKIFNRFLTEAMNRICNT